MILDVADIPSGKSFDDYPSGTEFALNDDPLKYDPETFEIVRPTSKRYSSAVTKEELLKIHKNK